MPTDPKVSIHLVTWNGRIHLPSCVRGLEEQTVKNYRLLIVENGSVDGTLAWIRENIPHAYVLRNNRNLGFAQAHNQAIRLASAPYVLCLNQDVILSPDWLRRAVSFMDAHPAVGSYGGRMVRFHYDESTLTGIKISGIIDSTGLVIRRSRHSFDRDSGQPEKSRTARTGAVFGVSAACALYRLTALHSVQYRDEFFDGNFFAYKEDVDLAWRLQRAGWDAWYDDQTVAYHHRSIQGQAATGSLALAENYRQRQSRNSAWSYRNHIWMLIKNETSQTWRRDWAWIIWYEFRKFIFFLFTRPYVLRQWVSIWKGWSMMRRKARATARQARRTPLEVRRWFLNSPA